MVRAALNERQGLRRKVWGPVKVVCGESMPYGVADALKTKRDCLTQSQMTLNKEINIPCTS